jgi:hypothetical protein
MADAEGFGRGDHEGADSSGNGGAQFP